MKRTLLAALLLLGAMGCNRGPKLAPVKPAEVLVSLPVTRTVSEFEEFTGRTEAVRNVDLRARVTGYLDKVNFKEGADVKENDVLFEIDPRIYRAELERAEANVGVNEARVKRLDFDFRRVESLLKTAAISKEEFDKVAGDREEAVAAVRVAKASRDLAKQNLDFCKVTAAVSGRISRTLLDPGNLVKADDTLLTTIVTQDPIYAYFDIDERTLLRLRRLVRDGKIKSARESPRTIELGLTDEDGFPLSGTIDFVDNKVDTNSGTLRIRGVFPNPKFLLSPGLFVRVRMPVGDPRSATLIAEQALGTDQGNKFVYVVDENNTVLIRRVKIGVLSEGMRAIDSGLKTDERVIVSGIQRVKPGATVAPKLVEMPIVGAPAAPAIKETAAAGG